MWKGRRRQPEQRNAPSPHTQSLPIPPHSRHIMFLTKWERNSFPPLQWGPCGVGLVGLRSWPWSMGWSPCPGIANTQTKQRGIQTQGDPTGKETTGPSQAGWTRATGPRCHDGWGEVRHGSRRGSPVSFSRDMGCGWEPGPQGVRGSAQSRQTALGEGKGHPTAMETRGPQRPQTHNTVGQSKSLWTGWWRSGCQIPTLPRSGWATPNQWLVLTVPKFLHLKIGYKRPTSQDFCEHQWDDVYENASTLSSA